MGAAIQIGTTNWGVVYLGRLVLGIGNGFLVTFSNIYCAEAAPAHLRAVLVALFSEWVTIGSIVGAAVTNATSKSLDKSSYQIPLGIQFIVPAMLAVGLFFVPESPRYLVNKGMLSQGRAALEELRGDSLNEKQFELEWVEMVKGIDEERKLAGSVGPRDMFRGSHSSTTLGWQRSWLMYKQELTYAEHYFVLQSLPVSCSRSPFVFKLLTMNSSNWKVRTDHAA